MTPRRHIFYLWGIQENLEEKRLGDYIDIATQRKEEAHEIFRDLHARVTGPAARDALDHRAREELRHKDFLVSCRNGGFRPDALKMCRALGCRVAGEDLWRKKKVAYLYADTAYPLTHGG